MLANVSFTILLDFCLTIELKIKYLVFSSQESHTGQLDLATDLQMAAQRDNAIGITLREVY